MPAEARSQPASYNSTLMPWPVYLALQNRFPQRIDETDVMWLHRVKPILEAERAALMPLSTRDFRNELRSAALNRGMRRIVGYDEKKMPGHEARRLAHNSEVISTNPYLQGATDPQAATKRFEDEMVEWLADMSDVSTPPSGAIFWNGINENRLAERVCEWNRSFPPGQVQFGQLEATTDVQYVNNKYTWTYGNAYHKYGEKVSEMLGVGATGHVTAVVRWGLNKWSIFTNTELPRMLYIMEGQIAKGIAPKMTDLTIIVIEPLGLPDRVKCYVNSDILSAPVWDKTVQGFPASAADCIKLAELGSYVGTSGYCQGGKKVVPASETFLSYLRSRPRNPSPATPKLLRDIEAIIHANQPMTRM
ncbi:MAG TPA: hypothetical protein VHA82_04190 [Ramlibacter sp.]|uniref:hypothetical protein n=1 Tax=Ramlibacter sp. TaxID=1917967 RepID=UPI002BD3F0B0|nr:hypothetical protein [Ramlibacter sp.]HVZ42990.1 hypothetical protein [Ramlibacter sp.]